MIRIVDMAGQRVFRGGLTVLFVTILIAAWTQGAGSNNWRAVGTGDCTGQDVAESIGPNPDDLKCTDAFRGQTAICREQSCTYKNIETTSCTGGTSLGRMYTCDSQVAQPVNFGNWRAVGTGDCPGQDVAESIGPNPDNLKCTDAFRGQTAICREQSCTYKNIETTSCTGGSSPDRMFTCSPVVVNESKTDSSGSKADIVTPIISRGMQPLAPPSDPVIYTNGNNRGVQNGPTRATTFVIDAPHLVTFIYTYHYLNGGKLPGKIGLKHADGTIYGPWRAEGAVGPGGVPNAYWFVLPYVELKTGSYTVTDSDTETWSYNRRSSNAGFAVIRGFRR